MITIGRTRITAGGGGGGNARASDTDALYWFSPTNVTTNDSDVVTTWPDNTGNGMDLGQFDSSPQPTFSTDSDCVVFDGTQILADMTTGTTDRAAGELLAGGEVAMFVVMELDASSVPPSDFAAFDMGIETNADVGAGQSIMFAFSHDTFGSPVTTIQMRARRFSDAAFVEWNSGQDFSKRKTILEFVCNQTNARMLVDGVDRDSAAVTTGNFPNSADQVISLGGKIFEPTLDADINFIGKISEVFVTSNADSDHRATIRAELDSDHNVIA